MNLQLLHVLGDLQGGSVVLDSNLVTLLVTSIYDPQLISRFKRTQMYSVEDAILLAWLVDHFVSVVTTAHILTETSNLGNSLSSSTRKGWFAALAEFTDVTSELFVPCRELTRTSEFLPFGLTDAALANLPGVHTVLTTDGRLASHLQAHGRPALDFNVLKHFV